MKEIIFTAFPNKEVMKVYPEYNSFHNTFKYILEQYHYHKALDLPDIWIRDFFPFQNSNTLGLYTFFYEPTYHSKQLSLRIRDRVKTHFLNSFDVPVRLDGGNLIINKKGVAFAFKKSVIFKNTTLDKVEQSIKRALDVNTITWLPCMIGDKFCHIDGLMQFLGDDILLINDYVYDEDLKAYMEKCIAIITKKHPWINIVKIPINAGDDAISAKGIYVNYLETSKIVFVPQYNLPEDKRVISMIKSFTKKEIVGIDCEAISKYGGSLHCLTSVQIN
jgi:agmatine/peptidylarginine deiminase